MFLIFWICILKGQEIYKIRKSWWKLSLFFCGLNYNKMIHSIILLYIKYMNKASRFNAMIFNLSLLTKIRDNLSNTKTKNIVTWYINLEKTICNIMQIPNLPFFLFFKLIIKWSEAYKAKCYNYIVIRIVVITICLAGI